MPAFLPIRNDPWRNRFVAFKAGLRLSAMFGRGLGRTERDCQKEDQAYRHHLPGVSFHVIILLNELSTRA
jgi:hypothetical protein